MKSLSNRHGLTLLELVVVLVILIALAGILVPMLPAMLGRAHTAEHGTNIAEINKAVEMFNIVNHGYPNYLDNLDGAYSVLPGGNSTSACGGQLIPVTLNNQTLTALSNTNVTSVYTLDTSTTRNLITAPYTGNRTDLASSTKVAGLDATAAARLYNATGNSTYVVFGLGTGSEMIGKPGGVMEAPLHFSDDKSQAGDPTKTYARFGLVFRVADDTGVSPASAQFVGAVALHEEAVTNGNDAASEYHEQNPQ